jgi:hypothetical protein
MDRKLPWEQIVDEHAREPGLGAPAGIFLLAGEYHVDRRCPRRIG